MARSGISPGTSGPGATAIQKSRKPKPGSSRVVAQGFRLLASDFWLLNIDKFLSMLALQAPKATMRSNGMRDDRYVLAIDMGSSSVKATLVSQRGELAGTGAVVGRGDRRGEVGAGHGRHSARAYRGRGVHHPVGRHGAGR